jgi:hypothetical protein
METQLSQDCELNKCISKFCLLKEPCVYQFKSVKNSAFHTVTKRKIRYISIYIPEFYFSENEVRWLNPSFPYTTEITFGVANFLYVKKEKGYTISHYSSHLLQTSVKIFLKHFLLISIIFGKHASLYTHLSSQSCFSIRPCHQHLCWGCWFYTKDERW